ncbi:MAG TPA: hypothetical protein VNA31_09750 [bacterium]|nr:hypothetical protein [bacterium]
MTLRITVDVYSGRSNPVVELRGRELREAVERLQPGRRLTRDELAPLPPSTLGYRGLLVEQVGPLARGLPRTFRVANGDLLGPGLAHRAADPEVEEFICRSSGPLRRLRLGRDFFLILGKEIGRLREIRYRYPWRHHPWPLSHRCRCAPLYEPQWWNVPQRQPVNNCYNYATNYRTDTFAQPGQAAGAIYTSLSCAAVRPAALADELIDSPAANNRCPKEGHLVALVVWPNGDFHWYRKGRNGFWTHKPGSTPVTNVDNSGHLIPDPRTADRGPYTQFCTFMVVMHGHIKIQ